MPQVSVMKGAEPWASEGDTTGVLVLHGFTGTPQSVRYWAEGIAADGRTVILPRLPGHGTTPDDMQRTNAAEWVAEAEMGLRGLQERCDRIFVCGLSMGGTITFDIAERFGDVLSGVVTVNASMFSRDPRVKLAPLLTAFAHFAKALDDADAAFAQKIAALALRSAVQARVEKLKSSLPQLEHIVNFDGPASDPRGQRVDHCEIERIERCRSVERQRCDRTFAREQHRVVDGHRKPV